MIMSSKIILIGQQQPPRTQNLSIVVVTRKPPVQIALMEKVKFGVMEIASGLTTNV